MRRGIRSRRGRPQCRPTRPLRHSSLEAEGFDTEGELAFNEEEIDALVKDAAAAVGKDREARAAAR